MIKNLTDPLATVRQSAYNTLNNMAASAKHEELNRIKYFLDVYLNPGPYDNGANAVRIALRREKIKNFKDWNESAFGNWDSSADAKNSIPPIFQEKYAGRERQRQYAEIMSLDRAEDIADFIGRKALAKIEVRIARTAYYNMPKLRPEIISMIYDGLGMLEIYDLKHGTDLQAKAALDILQAIDMKDVHYKNIKGNAGLSSDRMFSAISSALLSASTSETFSRFFGYLAYSYHQDLDVVLDKLDLLGIMVRAEKVGYPVNSMANVFFKVVGAPDAKSEHEGDGILKYWADQMWPGKVETFEVGERLSGLALEFFGFYSPNPKLAAHFQRRQQAYQQLKNWAIANQPTLDGLFKGARVLLGLEEQEAAKPELQLPPPAKEADVPTVTRRNAWMTEGRHRRDGKTPFRWPLDRFRKELYDFFDVRYDATKTELETMVNKKRSAAEATLKSSGDKTAYENALGEIDYKWQAIKDSPYQMYEEAQPVSSPVN